MKTILNKLFKNSEKEETADNSSANTPEPVTSPPAENTTNLIKMKEAMALIKASAPTVRKYARLGYYKEYRFGEKLVFYNRDEMLNFILNGSNGKRE